MLKIKDNIDLKKLEKYGFKNGFQEYYIQDKNYCTYLSIKKCSNRISTRNTDYKHEQVDEIIVILYDLIKDGLVENVGDDK